MKVFKNISLKKGYQFLLLKLGVFFIIAFMLDYFLGGILNYFYFKQSSGWEYRTKYSIEDTKADILIFGASRAQEQYNPVIFEERLNQTCYNVGRDGESIFYHAAILRGVLNRYTPKMIILDIENEAFIRYQGSYDRLSTLLPFYKNHKEMRSIIELKGPYENLKLLSNLYPYNSLLFKIAMGNLAINKKKNEDIKGYMPLARILNAPIGTIDVSNKYEIDSNKVKWYQTFIRECKKSNVKLYIVCSPYYFHSIGADTSMVLAKNIAARHQVDFVDFSKDAFFLNNSKLFANTIHVNVNGSNIFTNRLIDTVIAKNKNYSAK